MCSTSTLIIPSKKNSTGKHFFFFPFHIRTHSFTLDIRILIFRIKNRQKALSQIYKIQNENSIIRTFLLVYSLKDRKKQITVQMFHFTYNIYQIIKFNSPWFIQRNVKIFTPSDWLSTKCHCHLCRKTTKSSGPANRIKNKHNELFK